MTGQIVERRAGRVLLIDERDRVLLFRGCDPDHPDDKFWFSVGGGVMPGESDRQAACRELFEETGIEASPAELTGPVRELDEEFGFNGRRYRQRQVFFVHRVSGVVVDTSGQEAVELIAMDKYHWWSVAELDATEQRYYPLDLVPLLDEILCHSS